MQKYFFKSIIEMKFLIMGIVKIEFELKKIKKGDKIK